jgi:tetratricopeptide (TPR) repeat protein
VDAFAWSVVGSVTGAVGTVAAIVFGLIPLLRESRERRKVSPKLMGVERPAAEDSSQVPVVVGQIPQQPVAFQPRIGLLAGLDGNLPGRVVVVRAVTGMRGVGKTQLAAEYARARLADGWRLVAWISAEDADEVLAGLAAVAAALGLETRDRETAGRAVRHWLETGGERCLLVFDNAHDPAVLRPYIPAGGAAQVIITSNERLMGDLGAGVPLEVFTEQEALSYLAERTGMSSTEGARELAAELGYLPLALAQAAAVIAGQRLQYDTYLERLRALPAEKSLPPEKAGQYPRGVAAAVLLSIEAVRADDDTGAAVAVMELLAVLSAAGVRRTMIHAAGQKGIVGGSPQTAEVTDRTLAWLAAAALLTFSVDGTSVAAHRLVMRVIREQAAVRGTLAGTCTAVGELLDDLADSLDRSWREDRGAVQDLVEQVAALYGASAACRDDTRMGHLLTQLRWWAVWFLSELGDSTAQAIATAESLLADQEKVLGNDHPDTLTTRGNLANAYTDTGRTTEAIALHDQNLADQERVLDNDHPDTLRTRNNLAATYQAAGRTTEAIALHEQNLADQERVLGSDHPDTLRTRNNLAVAYQAAGRTTEAIALHQRNLANLDRVLGSDHPDTLITRGNLANAYLGNNRLETLRTRNNLSVVYQKPVRRSL